MNNYSHLGFRIAYDGSDYSGFQRQSHHRSIQAEIEKAWSPIFGVPIKIQFASRTDAGVHALDQWVMIQDGVRLYEMLPLRTQQALLISLNAVLPDAIRTWKVFRLRDDFNPGKGPLWKEYSYTIVNGPAADPLLRSNALWIRRPLDLRTMRFAARKFIGTHDFAAFAKRVSRYQDKTTRRILAAKIVERPHAELESTRIIEFVVRGDGFLHNMVRAMSGTLVEMGLGEKHDVSKILEGRSRSNAGVNAPPHPLVLRKIYVPSALWKPLDVVSSR